PLKGHRDMYLDVNGKVDRELSMNGATSAGIPGIPAALNHLQENYGVLPLSNTLASAIKYAEQGFEVDRVYHNLAEFRLEVLRRYRSSRETLLHKGEVPEQGSLIKQQDLAGTLRQLVSHGEAGFYKGEVAQKLVDSVRLHGGIWSLQDLSQYQLIEREPLRFSFKGATFVTATLPSSGGIVLASIFNMLDEMEFYTAADIQRVHMLVEAMRRAYRDRATHLGDSDYVDIDQQLLLSRDYAKSLLENYSSQRATPSSSLGNITDNAAGTDTTHFSIIDEHGNMVSATLSINYPFGSGLIAEGTGVLLNDEMDDFSASPGAPNAYGLLGSDANAIQPGKRMLSSMTPAFVYSGQRRMISGTPGGSRIITMQLLGMLEFLRGGSAAQIVSLPRFHHQYFPDSIYHEENAFDMETQKALIELGHELKRSPYRYGNMQTIVVNQQSGEMQAASDPRGLGTAVVGQ
ncbi:MAG: gamma-glutamyltransferase family protein, partial [Gammaproteobacteria bacterium]|nr:gamma-glutamyltransferase family protein [Gammaproteobacteria bacterium]